MARFVRTLDVWQLDASQRAKLQPGQWVTAGPNGPKGRFLGEAPRSTVCAWLGNARGAAGGPAAYFRTIRSYARSLGAR